MAQFDCSKCGSQGLEWKEGVGKKTGKRWTAWYCPDCKIMHGMDGRAWGDKQSAPSPKFVPPTKQNNAPMPTNSIEKKLDLILEILKQNFPPLAEAPEETPGVPF